MPLVHHRPAFGRVREFVADQHTVFVVLIRRCRMRMAWHARDRARRDAAFGDFVALVTILSIRRISGNDHLAPIDFRIEVELFGINRGPAFREQQIAENDPGALETVGKVVHFRNESEAIQDVGRRRDESWKVAESGAQHLP